MTSIIVRGDTDRYTSGAAIAAGSQVQPDAMHATALVASERATVDLATRVQRRRDFTAHLAGFLSGAVVLGVISWRLPGLRSGAFATLLAWSTALSFQHFRHVLRGPVSIADVAAEQARLTASR